MDFESLLEALLYVKSIITMPVSNFLFIFIIIIILEVGNGNAV